MIEGSSSTAAMYILRCMEYYFFISILSRRMFRNAVFISEIFHHWRENYIEPARKFEQLHSDGCVEIRMAQAARSNGFCIFSNLD